MCATDDFLVLSQSENAQITYCRKCKAFSLAYKSCCASFLTAELPQFQQMLENLETEDFRYQMMGKSMAIVKPPQLNLGFCLTQDDTKVMTDMIGTSLALFQALQIVDHD